jgi:hypothetical protein
MSSTSVCRTVIFTPHTSAYCASASFFFSFQLHDNALSLHEYTRDQRKKAAHGEGDGFLDDELDNFQDPELSSLGRLVRSHLVGFSAPIDVFAHRIWTASYSYDITPHQENPKKLNLT